MTPTRGSRLAGVAIVGGFGLILFAALALLVRFLRLALLGIAYAGAVILACLLLAAQNIAGRIRRYRSRPLAAYPLEDDRLWPVPPAEPHDVTGPIPPPAALTGDPTAGGRYAVPGSWEDYARRRAQDPRTLVDADTMTATRIGSANRLAAVVRLLDVVPSLDVEDAAALADGAALLLDAGMPDAARRLLGLTAPATAAELVAILER